MLRNNGAINAPLKQLLDHIAGWTRTARTGDLAEAERVRAEIAALVPVIDAKASRDDIIFSGLLARLRELTALVHDIIAPRREIRQG